MRSQSQIGPSPGCPQVQVAPRPSSMWPLRQETPRRRCRISKSFSIMEKSGGKARPSGRTFVCTGVQIVSESKTFSGIERRRNPGGEVELPNATEVSIFHELGKALTSSLQLDQVLRTIMEKINEFLRPDTWSLLLMDQEKNELYFQIATGAGAEALRDVRIKLGQGIAGWVAQSGEVIVVPDTSNDSRFFAKVDERTKMETRSFVAVPVRFRVHCLGVIELIN